MALQLVACFVALLWLLHRATKLLKIPAPALIQILGIDIPEAPKVSIDSVSDTTVALHWNPPEKASSVVKYILEIDGKKAGETDRSDFNVTIKDLQPYRAYTLTILAVNPNNYRSHSAPIRVRTKKSKDEAIPKDFQFGVSRDDSQKTLRNRASSKNLNLRNRLRSGSETKSSTSEVYTVEELTGEVEQTQMEINEVNQQERQLMEDHKVQESQLVGELEKLKDLKKVEDDQKLSVRSEIKTLEDSKRNLENQRTRLTRQLKQLEDDSKKKNDTMKQWQVEIDEAKETEANFNQVVSDMKLDYEQKLEDLKQKVNEYQDSITNAEEEIKRLSSTNRKVGNVKSATMNALHEIREAFDHDTGLINDDVLTKIMNDKNVDEEFKTRVKQENDTEKSLQEEWFQVQKDLEMRYLNAKTRHEQSIVEKNEAEVQYNRLERARRSSVSLDQQLNPPTTMFRKHSAASENSVETYPDYFNSRAANQQSFRNSATSLVVTSSQSSNVASATTHTHTAPTSARVSMDTGFRGSVGPLSPEINHLLPSGLLGHDEMRDSFEAFMRESNGNNNEDDDDQFARPSGSILGNALHSKGSFDNTSPKPSVMSLGSDGSMSPMNGTSANNAPSSPQGSGSFSNFATSSLSRNNSVGYKNVFQDETATQQPSAATVKSKTRSFFFRTARRNNNEQQKQDSDNDISPIGSARARAGSYSSVNSRGGAGSNMLNPWLDEPVLGDVESSPPHASANNNNIMPAISNNGSVLSFDSGRFGHIGSSRADLLDQTPAPSKAESRFWNFSKTNQANTATSPPQLVLNDNEVETEPILGSNQSTDSKSSAGNSNGSKFSKSFANLFGSTPNDKESNSNNNNNNNSCSSSNNNNNNNNNNRDKEKNIAALFGKDEEIEPKENMFQKSMRAFTPNRKSSSSSSTAAAPLVTNPAAPNGSVPPSSSSAIGAPSAVGGGPTTPTTPGAGSKIRRSFSFFKKSDHSNAKEGDAHAIIEESDTDNEEVEHPPPTATEK